EIDTTLSRRAGDEVAMALAAERGEIRREPRHFLGAGEEGEIAIAAAMQLAGRRAKRRGELRRQSTGLRRQGGKIERQAFALARHAEHARFHCPEADALARRLEE